MKFLLLSFCFLFADFCNAAAHPHGTPAGFLHHMNALDKSHRIMAVGGGAVLGAAAHESVDNWHSSYKQLLVSFIMNLDKIHQPAPGAGVGEVNLWGEIRNATYAMASMTVVYTHAGQRKTKHYSFPYVFASGRYTKAKMRIMDQLEFQLCSYNTLDHATGNCRNLKVLESMADAAFNAATNGSKQVFVDHFRRHYGGPPGVHPILAAYALNAGHFPFNNVHDAGLYRPHLAHAEMVAYYHFRRRYDAIIADMAIPPAEIDLITFNVVVSRDMCEQCRRRIYLESFDDLVRPAPGGAPAAPGVAAPPPIPFLITVSTLKEYRDSRETVDLLVRHGQKILPAGGHHVGGVLYLYR